MEDATTLYTLPPPRGVVMSLFGVWCCNLTRERPPTWSDRGNDERTNCEIPSLPTLPSPAYPCPSFLLYLDYLPKRFHVEALR